MKSMNQIPLLPETDEDGLILDPEQWNEEVANTTASLLAIGPLSNEHWLVINELRSYYYKFGVAPAMNHVCSQYGKDKMWVHNLFGTCLNAWCIAGLPNPGESRSV